MLQVDPESWVPPYEQLRNQIRGQVERGELAPGHRLPPVRRLAADLGLATNTVARAYRELEHAGAVVARGARGTFVRERADVAVSGAAAPGAAAPGAAAPGAAASGAAVGVPPDVETAAADYARRAVAHGLSPDRALALIRAAFDAVSSELAAGPGTAPDGGRP